MFFGILIFLTNLIQEGQQEDSDSPTVLYLNDICYHIPAMIWTSWKPGHYSFGRLFPYISTEVLRSTAENLLVEMLLTLYIFYTSLVNVDYKGQNLEMNKHRDKLTHSF